MGDSELAQIASFSLQSPPSNEQRFVHALHTAIAQPMIKNSNVIEVVDTNRFEVQK
jgi:hypothetical protein